MLPQLVIELCEMLKIPPLEPDARGGFAIVFDDNLDVEIVPLSGPQFLIRARINDLPDDEQEREAFYRKHLQHNLLNLHGQFCSLSLDREEGTIWLYQMERDDRIDARRLYQIIGDFVTTLEWWRKLEGESNVTSPAQISPMNFIQP